jgi:hypothetical protein
LELEHEEHTTTRRHAEMESKQSDENEAAREEVEGTKPYQSLVLFIAGVSNRLSILQPTFRRTHRAAAARRSPRPLYYRPASLPT